MKKIFSLLMMLLPLMASAQNESRRVSLEPRVGMTVSKMSGSALTASGKWKMGCTAGGGGDSAGRLPFAYNGC